MSVLQHSARPVAAPSPLVGEGSSVAQPVLVWVRGPLAAIPRRRSPLTRLRFAKPPSPTADDGYAVATRGEGKERASAHSVVMRGLDPRIHLLRQEPSSQTI